MGETFGMDVEEIERQVVRLIQTGGIQARVDSRNKVWLGLPLMRIPRLSGTELGCIIRYYKQGIRTLGLRHFPWHLRLGSVFKNPIVNSCFV